MEFNPFLTAVLTGLIIGLMLISAFAVYFRLQKRRFFKFIDSWVTAPDEKTPSQLAAWVDQLAFIFAQRLVLQMKSTVMGMNSVDVKNERKEKMDQALAGTPTLAALINLIPGARRWLKSPEAVAIATGMLKKVGKGNGGEPPPAEAAGRGKIIFDL